LLGSSSFLRLEAADGDLDPTFDADGQVTTDYLGQPLGLGGHDRASAIALQSDGKIVVAGFVGNAVFDLVLGLARYNPDGSLDTTFGVAGSGKLEIPFLAGFTPSEREGVDVAIQPGDGRIVIAGTILSGDGFTTDFGIARFEPDGTLDASFGTGGLVTTDFGSPGDQFATSDGAASVALQSDGKIVVAGFARKNGGPSHFALARYETDGTLDSTFGPDLNGRLTINFFGESFGEEDWANGVAIQTDGNIVAAGVAIEMSSSLEFRRYAATVRLLGSNGTLDSTFGTSGTTTVDFVPGGEFGSVANAVALQADGAIVIAGAGFSNVPATGWDFALARYTMSGALDSTFDGDGIVTTNFLTFVDSGGFEFGGLDLANDVTLQSDGKIVAVGSITDSDFELGLDFGLARYNVDGALDTTFGAALSGKVITPFGNIDAAHGVAIQKDCKIAVAGYSWEIQSGDSNFALARYDGGDCSVPPPTACPHSQGYWKNHADSWPVTSLTLGAQVYSKPELLALLANPSGGDASAILARQLIAATLNIANGADPGPVAATIVHADAVLAGFGGKLPYKVKPASPVGQSITADGTMLDQYNNGLVTPACTP
jgi:uncharacterized delta-60 repeat protein